LAPTFVLLLNSHYAGANNSFAKILQSAIVTPSWCSFPKKSCYSSCDGFETDKWGHGLESEIWDYP